MSYSSIRQLSGLLLAALLWWQTGAVADDLQLQEVLPEGSQYGLLVLPVDEAASPLLQHNPDLLLPPASTMKLFTALAAQLALPADFRFTTRVERVGDDLVIRFAGDPTLPRATLLEMLTQAREKFGQGGIGDIWIDDTAFNGRQRGLGWPWENLGHCYSSPIGAVSIDDNCVPVGVYSDRKPGDKLRVNVPAHQPIRFEVSAEVVTAEQKLERRCDLDLDAAPDNTYHLSGCWPVSKNPLGLKVAVQNPSLFARDLVEAQLKPLGLAIRGKVRIGKPAGGEAQTLTQHQSAPLTALIKQMLEHSDNQIADALLKSLGAHHFKQPASYRTGLVALRRVLKEQAGIDLGNAVIEDGSGLSRSNRVSVRHLAQVVGYLYRHDAQLGLLGLLPVSGESGTLHYRASVSKPPLKGRLRAKTGTLFGTKNLAGVFTTAKGTPLVVVQIVTNCFPAAKAKGPKPVMRFEQRLYNKLYSDY